MLLLEVVKWKLEICWKVACLQQKLVSVIRKWVQLLQSSTELCILSLHGVSSTLFWNPRLLDTKGLPVAQPDHFLTSVCLPDQPHTKISSRIPSPKILPHKCQKEAGIRHVSHSFPGTLFWCLVSLRRNLQSSSDSRCFPGASLSCLIFHCTLSRFTLPRHSPSSPICDCHRLGFFFTFECSFLHSFKIFFLFQYLLGICSNVALSQTTRSKILFPSGHSPLILTDFFSCFIPDNSCKIAGLSSLTMTHGGLTCICFLLLFKLTA